MSQVYFIVSDLNRLYLLIVFQVICFLNLYAFVVPDDERPEFYFADLNKSLKDLSLNSPVMKLGELDITVAQANYLLAKSEQGIRLGINTFGQSIHEDRPSQDFYHRYRILNQVYLKKPLFHWGALQAQEEIGRLNNDLSQQNLRFRTRRLRGELRSVFLELIVLNYRLQLANEQINLAKQSVQSAEEKIKVGLGTELSLEEARAETLNRQISKSDIKVSLQHKYTQFISLSGYSEELDLTIPEDFWSFCLKENPNSSFPVMVGSLNSDEIEHFKAQVSIEDQRIIIADSELKPKINLTGAYFQDQIDTAESGKNVDRNNFLIGLEASWAIWDSHKSKAQKRAAIARKSKFEHLIKAKSDEKRKNLKVMSDELDSLKERIALGRKLTSVAQSRLEKSNLELSLDRISPLEHFASVVALDHAKIRNLEAACKYMMLLDQYEQIVANL